MTINTTIPGVSLNMRILVFPEDNSANYIKGDLYTRHMKLTEVSVTREMG